MAKTVIEKRDSGEWTNLQELKEYIVYSDTKMKVFNQFECHTKEGTITNKSIKKSNSNSDKCVAIYFEIDTNLFQENNSDTTITSNWMTSIFNNVQTLFNNDGISVGLKSIFIWTDPESNQLDMAKSLMLFAIFALTRLPAAFRLP